MTLKSQFGNTRSALDAPVSHSHGHGILHNLLEDAINTATGIPFGIVKTVEHPIQSAKLIGKSYADTYGHGWGHFWHSFHSHPLQPLLDAISVPLILAGGAGFAIKGASAAAELGRAAELGDAWAQGMDEVNRLTKAGDFAGAEKVKIGLARHPNLYKQSLRFKQGTTATTRMLDTPMPGVSLPQAYSTNLFRRALTKGSNAIFEGLGNKVERLDPETGALRGANPFSTRGKGARMLEQKISKHKAAAAARSFGQARVAFEGLKKGEDPAMVAKALNDDFVHVAFDNMTWAKASPEELLKSKHFNDQWEFVYRAPDTEATVWTGDARTGLVAEKGMIPGEGPMLKEHEFAVGKDGRIESKHIQNFITKLPERIKTGMSPKRALRDENGRVAIMRKGAMRQMADDMAGSAKLAEQIYKSPLKAWKFFILAAAPRYFVNNVIGNAGMYAAATNPVEFTRGVLSAVKHVRGDAAARDLESQMTSSLQQLMDKHLPNEWVSQNMGFLQHGALGVEQTAGMGTRSPTGRMARSGLYEVTEKASYRAPQRASMMGAMVTDEDFRNFYRLNKKRGMSESAAFQKAANDVVRNPLKQAAIEKRVTDWAGQYYHLTKLEKLITAFVPFYNWDRHALRFGKEQVLSRPVRTATLASLGALGDKETSKELGKLPDFMKGAIPVSGASGGVLGFLFGQRIKGRQKIILTRGYNPLAAAADDAHALAALIGARNPEEVAGQLNPVVSGALAGITGQNIFSGARVPRGLDIAGHRGGGILGTAAQSAFGDLPQVKLAEAEFGGAPSTKTKRGEPTLYTHSVRQQLSSLFGLNERDYSPATAAKLYRAEHGVKKGRRKKRKDASKMASALKSNF